MNLRRLSTAIAALCLCATGGAYAHASPAAVSVKLVRDINQRADHATPQNFLSVGRETYFAATSPGLGSELWKTDGTAAGTTLVRDINPGPGDSSPEQLTTVGSEIYFAATDGRATSELWKTDGTAAGTLLVKVIGRGRYASPPFLWLSLGKRLVFTVGDEVESRLWVTDGTSTGTHIISDTLVHTCVFYPDDFGTYGHGLLTGCIVRFHGTLLFSTRGDELWRTDGTRHGTYRVAPITADYFAVFKGHVFFDGGPAAYEPELWRTDGTTKGTILFKDLSPDSRAGDLTVAGDTLYFHSAKVVNFGEVSESLWKSDGTRAGTVPITTFKGDSVNIGLLTPVNLAPGGPPVVFFDANTHGYGDELWVTDGTRSGTHLVRDINPGKGDALASWLTPLDTGSRSVLLFTAVNHDGEALWRTDGTKAGTHEISGLLHALELTAVQSEGKQVVLLEGLDSPGQLKRAGPTSHGYQLWESNGTLSGTRILELINPATQGSITEPGASLGGTLIFSGDDGGFHGEQPWSSDGTARGTKLITEIGSRFEADEFGYTAVGKAVLFIGYDGREEEVYATDGTAHGTRQITHFVSADEENPQSPYYLTAVGDEAFFVADDGTHGYELWKTDGTERGTEMVTNINPHGGSFPSVLTDVDGLLYFIANDGSHGNELWRSDGTAKGTAMVRDINSGQASTNIDEIGHAGSELFFWANDAKHGTELWKSDGTEKGTGLVRDINRGTASSSPGGFTAFKGRIYFHAADARGEELWTSDGTRDGTKLVDDIRPGSKSSNPSSLTVAGGALFFAAGDTGHGRELWSTQGTKTTTHMVRDIDKGAGSSTPSVLTEWNGSLWLTADDGKHGAELWSSNGTTKGTHMVRDIFPGNLGADISWMVPTPARLYFAADDGSHGLELWSAGQ
jgi:ELWxxDGT repeat protein